MAVQMTFERYELKYMLSLAQKEKIQKVIAPHMSLDDYGYTTIRNIYYDTQNYRLIRHSIEKPVYKEKLRLRSYSRVEENDPVFVELKKKFDSVVYKRRLVMPQQKAMDWIARKSNDEPDSQIAREINYFIDYYETLHPTVFLSYEREAYYAQDGSDFRVTFDNNILCRRDNLSLTADVRGVPLLPEGMVLMELKTSGGIPLWMTRALTQEQIYKTSFSKYGAAYETLIHKKHFDIGGKLHA